MGQQDFINAVRKGSPSILTMKDVAELMSCRIPSCIKSFNKVKGDIDRGMYPDLKYKVIITNGKAIKINDRSIKSKGFIVWSTVKKKVNLNKANDTVYYEN